MNRRVDGGLRKFLIGAVLTSGSYFAGNGCGFPIGGLGFDMIPARIDNVKILREDACEEEMQRERMKIAEWTLRPETADFIQTNGAGVEVEGDGPNPFRPELVGTDTNGDGFLESWALYARDAENQLPEGDAKVYNIQVRPSSNTAWIAPTGGIPGPSIVSFVGTGNGGFDIKFNYQNCNPDPDLPYTPGDGLCEVEFGEDNINSPEDCIVPCGSNSDCGLEGYVGGEYCLQGNIVRDYVAHNCENAGTMDSYCASNSEPRIIEECVLGCDENGCLELKDLAYVAINGVERGTGNGFVNLGLNHTNFFVQEALYQMGDPTGINYTELGAGVVQPGCLRVDSYTPLIRNPALDGNGYRAYTSDFSVVKDAGCPQNMDLFQAEVGFAPFTTTVNDSELGV